MRPKNSSAPLALIALATLGVTTPAKPTKSPYTVIIGDLVSQKDAPGNPCGPDEDICVDVMLETRLRNVETLAGNPIEGNLSVRHRQHAPYRRNIRLRLAMIIGPKLGKYHRGINLGQPEKHQICVDKSWFAPNENGMRIPTGLRIDKGDNVCFDVR